MRTIFLYIMLVGIMLVVLLEILRVGEKIQAPLNVSGNWLIKKESAIQLKENCLISPSTKSNLRFNIEQSGTYLVLTLNNSTNTRLNGKLDGDSLKFRGNIPITAKDKICGNEIDVNLSLKLVKESNSLDEFAGTWSTTNCSRCSNISFSAVKESHEE